MTTIGLANQRICTMAICLSYSREVSLVYALELVYFLSYSVGRRKMRKVHFIQHTGKSTNQIYCTVPSKTKDPDYTRYQVASAQGGTTDVARPCSTSWPSSRSSECSAHAPANPSHVSCQHNSQSFAGAQYSPASPASNHFRSATSAEGLHLWIYAFGAVEEACEVVPSMCVRRVNPRASSSREGVVGTRATREGRAEG